MNLLQLHEPGETPLPHAEEASPAVGIDLGTTHSAVAFAQGGKAEVLRNTHGHALIPSVVDYTQNTPVVGHPAREARARGAADAVASVKRLMGRAAADIRPLLGQAPYEILPAESEGGMVRLRAGGKTLTPVEISAEILRELKQVAERALGKPISRAVITVPAYFDDAARTATRDAARLAGLQTLRLVNEPTAAALAYGLDAGAEGVYAIYDLGGGTFDISLLKLEKGVFQVLSTGGDTALGGDDFDAAMVEYLHKDGHSSENLGPLLAAARVAKEALSEKESVAIPPRPSSGHKAGGVAVELTRSQLNRLIAPLVERTLAICARALADAKLEAKDIHGVVLVGGSTRVPLVREKVAEFFGKPPLSGVNPDEVVAIGAALQAEALAHGSGALLLDVVPLSLGLETMGGIVEKLIPRNTPIPVAVAQEFTTYQDGQSGMQLHIVQGEREMSAQCRSLARFELKGIPPLPAGIARVRVAFTVDADGLLSVSAEELTTGAAQRIEVKPSYGLEPEEIERMLTESMRHAREDITGRLLTEAKVEAQRNVIEVESALKADGDLLSDAERTLISRQIAYLTEAVRGDDRERIDVEMRQLAHLTQPFAEKRMDRAVNAVLKGAHVSEV